jgi:hypothetical protein
MEEYINHRETMDLLRKYEFRSFMDTKFQSWSSFTSQLFGDDKIRESLIKLSFILIWTQKIKMDVLNMIRGKKDMKNL